MKRTFAIAAVAGLLLVGGTRAVWNADAQQPFEQLTPAQQDLKDKLRNASIVGFQSTAADAQLLYKVNTMAGELILCRWKLTPKAEALGCEFLPLQFKN